MRQRKPKPPPPPPDPSMVSKRVCQEIVEALARQNPGCPLARQCDIFRSTCLVPNVIDMTEPENKKKPNKPTKVKP